MARHISSTPCTLPYYPSSSISTTTSFSSSKQKHKRVHSSTHHPSEPPSKRRPSPSTTTTTTTTMTPIPSPNTSPTPTYAYIVLLTLTPIGTFPQPVEQNHGIFTQLSDANVQVSRLRTGAHFSRDAVKGYRAEVVNGALSWSVGWGGMRWEGVEVRVMRVEVRSVWGTEFEGLSLGNGEVGEGEDEGMS